MQTLTATAHTNTHTCVTASRDAHRALAQDILATHISNDTPCVCAARVRFGPRSCCVIRARNVCVSQVHRRLTRTHTHAVSCTAVLGLDIGLPDRDGSIPHMQPADDRQCVKRSCPLVQVGHFARLCHMHHTLRIKLRITLTETVVWYTRSRLISKCSFNRD